MRASVILRGMGGSTRSGNTDGGRAAWSQIAVAVARAFADAGSLDSALAATLRSIAESLGCAYVAWVEIDRARAQARCIAARGARGGRFAPGQSQPWPARGGVSGLPHERVLPAGAGALVIADRRPLSATARASAASSVAAELDAWTRLRRTTDAAERQASLLKLACEVGRDALADLPRTELLARVLRHFVDEYATIEATILLEAPARDHLEVAAHLGASAHITHVGKLWPVARGVVGRCWREAAPVHVDRVADDPDYVTVNPAVTAQLAVPIRHRGRLFGVLNLEAVAADSFARIDRYLLDTLVDHVGGAIYLATVQRDLDASRAALSRASSRLQAMSDALERRASAESRDPVSGLPTGAAWNAGLLRLRRAARRQRAWFAVVAVRPVETAKPKNPSVQIARAVAMIGDDCVVGAIGGDWFGIATIGDDADAVVDALRRAVRRHDLCGAAVIVAAGARTTGASLVVQAREHARAATEPLKIVRIEARPRGRPRKSIDDAARRSHRAARSPGRVG